MEFVNNTGKTEKIRIGSDTNNSGYDWLNIKNGDTVEIPEQYGVRLSFDPVVEQKVEEKQKEPVKVPEKKPELKEDPKKEEPIVEVKKKVKHSKTKFKK